MTLVNEDMIKQIRALPADQIRRRFGYDLGQLPNAYLRSLEANCHDLSSAVRSTGLSIGYPAWNLLYYTLLCSLRSSDPVVIETGTNLGFSTIVMAQALSDVGSSTPVRTVDLNEAAVIHAKQNANAAGLADFIEFAVGDSLEFLQHEIEQSDRIDFAFLDGSHESRHVLSEFNLIQPLVQACGGTVFFDNTSAGGVAEALCQIRKQYGGNLVEFGNCSWGPPGNAIWQP